MATATCKRCGKTFTLHHDRGKIYCSRQCYDGMGLPDEERFWRQVGKTEGCWEWQGCKTNNYGRCLYQGKLTSTHRVSWLLTHGSIDDGLFVLHHCDNRRCVRPSHLYLGTAADNARDARERGRFPTGDRSFSHLHPELMRRGQDSPTSKLQDEQVMEIRRLYRSGNHTTDSLAELFGVTRACISAIVRNITWTHLPLMAREAETPPDTLTVTEAAFLLGVCQQAIREAIYGGYLTAFQGPRGLGRTKRWYIPLASLETYKPVPRRQR